MYIVYIYIYVLNYIYIFAHAYIIIYVCINICIHANTYIYIFIHTHLFFFRKLRTLAFVLLAGWLSLSQRWEELDDSMWPQPKGGQWIQPTVAASADHDSKSVGTKSKIVQGIPWMTIRFGYFSIKGSDKLYKTGTLPNGSLGWLAIVDNFHVYPVCFK